MFLRRMAESAEPDTPLARLADMLRRRQLFKPVPLKQQQLTQLALDPSRRGDEGWNRIDTILRKRGYDPPDRFRFLDAAKFRFFHEGPPGQGSWLIDQRSRKRREASPVRREEALVHHRERRENISLFVPSDAVRPIVDAWDER
jgi:hypothetical protein